MRSASAAVVLAAVVLTGCGGPASPSDNTSETFNGTLTVGGQNSHPFNAKSGGEVSMSVRTLAPVSNAIVGLALGFAVNGACLDTNPPLITQNGFTGVGLPGLATVLQDGGNYCVYIYDVGGLTADSTYSISLSHP